jgi:hypothetical protein
MWAPPLSRGAADRHIAGTWGVHLTKTDMGKGACEPGEPIGAAMGAVGDASRGKHSEAFPHNPVYNRGKARFLAP